jgi:hypothetical protein
MFVESGSIQKVQTPHACANFLKKSMSTCEGGVLQMTCKTLEVLTKYVLLS